MRFKTNKLAAAVAVTLGTSAVVVSTARADEILFPYLVSSATVTTLVSVINNADINFGFGEAPRELHYRYWYKNGGNAESNGAKCSEVNRPLPSSANDIVTFDTGGQYANNNLNILFEKADEATNVNPTAGYGKAPFALLKGLAQPVRAFLLVDNDDFVADPTQTFLRTSESLAGEAVVLEFQNGAAWGYSAYNASGRYRADGVRFNFFDFSDYAETAGEVISGHVSGQNFVPVALAPFVQTGGEFITKFFVTPIKPSFQDDALAAVAGLPADFWFPPNTVRIFDAAGVLVGVAFSPEATAGQGRGDLNARVQLAINDPSLSATAAVYDRDEGPVSGRVPQDVVCVGAVDATSMLTEGARLQVPDGGWSNLLVGPGNLNNTAPTPGTTAYATTNEAIVIKLEYNVEAPLKLDDDKDSPVIRGIVNNAIWLRKGIRESVPTVGTAIPRIQLFTDGLDINTSSAPQ